MIARQPNPLPPADPDAPSSDVPFAPLPFAISAPAAALLEQLAAGADPAALAAAHNLSLAALALWVREPHVQAMLDALNDLLALHRAAWRRQVVKDTVESLREVMQHADTLPERRRAATQIIRALNDRQSRVREHAGRAPDASRDVTNASDLTHASGARSSSEGPRSDGRSPRFEISDPPSNSPPHTPHSTPAQPSAAHAHPRASSSANATAELVVTALQQQPGDPVVIDAIRALVGVRALQSDADFRAFDASLQLLIDALPDADVTSTPAEPEPDGIHFRKRYTLTCAAAEPVHLLFRLGCDPNSSDCWLEEISRIDSS